MKNDLKIESITLFRSKGKPVNENDDMVRVVIDIKKIDQVKFLHFLTRYENNTIENYDYFRGRNDALTEIRNNINLELNK